MMTEECITRIVDVVVGFQKVATAQGSVSVSLIATSATRDASNAQQLAKRIDQETGLHLRVLTGDEEAALSFAGGALSGECGMIDVGGGSTEIIVGLDGVPHHTLSMQMGAIRLSQQSDTQADQLCERLESEIASAWKFSTPQLWVGVGGTCTTLADIDAGLVNHSEGYQLTYNHAEDIMKRLAVMSPVERSNLPGLPPKRADIIVAGAVLVVACMRVLRINILQTTKRNNLDGWLIYDSGSSMP